MLFNAKPAARATRWTLFGEPVAVKDSYVYLGTVTPEDGLSWTAHLKDAIGKARRRSADLLWVCRADRGMRPRTAVTLWQSLVRPLLEYTCELWSGQVPAKLVKEAESVQCTFLRGTLGLHANGSGVADDAVRAETGCEMLVDRWAKLKLGFWRRLFVAAPDRLLRVVAAFRHSENVQSDGRGYGSRGWMPTARAELARVGLADYWEDPRETTTDDEDIWKARAVEAAAEADRQARMENMPSVRFYNKIKDWGVNPADYSFSLGEIGRRGRLVPERYLDDRQQLKGTRLKLLCRLHCLPVMARIGREVTPKWPKRDRVCYACGTGAVEDVRHFVMDCPSYARRRADLFDRVGTIMERSVHPPIEQQADRLTGRQTDGQAGRQAGRQAGGQTDRQPFADLDSWTQYEILLGKRFGDPLAENRIDAAVKRYLTKTWNSRAGVAAAINAALGTSYDVQTCALTSRANGH
jgi:hypothetical protein